jgi:hypothetical protein
MGEVVNLENNKLQNLTGTIVFKEDGDEIRQYRVKGYSKSSTAAICLDGDGNLSYIPIDQFKEYKMLQSDGMFMISSVKMDKSGKIKDVIVSVSKTLELQMGLVKPYAICRQSVTDVFYNLICNTEDDQMAGLSVNRDNCPANIDMGVMMSCYDVIKSDVVYFYREDTIEDILKFINLRDYDMVLKNLYQKHAHACGDPKALISKEHAGWCSNVKLLLEQNNFQADINEMLGITDIAFKLEDYMIEKPLPDESKGGYYTVGDDLKLWLSGTFRVCIDDITILEYKHDINLSDLNNARYFMLRDSDKKLYICVYTVKGEYLESDLEDAYEKKSFIDEWRIDFVDKYKKSRKLDSNN